MSDLLSRREFVGRVGAAGAMLALAPSGWAAAVGRAEADATGLLVRPYLQPGAQAAPEGPDSKDLVWLTDARGGSYAVEYGWAGGPARTATVNRTEIRLAAPTPEQLHKKPKTNPLGQPHEDVKVTSLDSSPQHYVKFWAALTDLPRDATAWYRVRRTGGTGGGTGGGTSGLTSGSSPGGAADVVSQNAFRTRATPGRAVRFIAVGDLATGRASQAAVAYRAGLLEPDFFVALGDLCYSMGRVSQYMDHFWGTYAAPRDRAGAAVGTPLMETCPFYALLGNHDVDTSLNTFPDCLGAFYFFHAPSNGPGVGRWNTPAGKDKAEAARLRAAAPRGYPNLASYSFDEGPAHFAVVDSNGYCPADDPALLAWLERDLTASRAPWKFVCMHAPMFHSSPAHYTEQKMRVLSPLLERCGVDVVWAGHVHNYQRSRPLRFTPDPRKKGEKLVGGRFTIDTTFDGVRNTRADGIIHVVSGGGGGSLIKDDPRKVDKQLREKYGERVWAPYAAAHVADRHSVVVCDATASRLTVRAVDAAGKELDRFVVTKG